MYQVKPRLLLPNSTIQKKELPDFYVSIRFLLLLAHYFGFFPLDGLHSKNSKKLKFSLSTWNIFYTIFIIIWTFIQFCLCFGYLIVSANFLRVNSLMFFFRVMYTSLLFVLLAKDFPLLMKHFSEVESILKHYPLSKSPRKEIHNLAIGIFVSAFVEHILVQIGNFIKVYNCEHVLNGNMLKFYFTVITFPQVFEFLPYSVFFGFFLLILNLILAFGWNFLDAFIILSSTAFSSKLKQFEEKISTLRNQKVCDVKIWKHTREDFTQLFHLFKDFNERLNHIIIVSFSTNLFFILWQLYSSLTMVQTSILQIYFIISLMLLIMRVFFICLYGAKFHDGSVNLINLLSTVQSDVYNEEIDRFIVEINSSPLILSGCRFFNVTKGLILEIAGTIVTYELVLIQFSGQLAINGSANSTIC